MAFREGQANLRMALHVSLSKHVERTDEVCRRVFDILELFRERQCPLRLRRRRLPGNADVERSALLKTMAQMNYLSF